MRNAGAQPRARTSAVLAAAIGLLLGTAGSSLAIARAVIPNDVQTKAAMATHAKGTFDVKLNPQSPDESALGRMTIDKQFHGDLEATSKGQMLAASTEVQGSAGYVAMERVSGTLSGRTGSFVLQHSGTMTRGEPQLSVTVVPDSGTGQLTGLVGKMAITIVEKAHLYDFEYSLPEAR